VIARALEKYRGNKLVGDLFSGLRPAVTGLIAAAAWSVIHAALMTGAIADGILEAIDWQKRRRAVFRVLRADDAQKAEKRPSGVLLSRGRRGWSADGFALGAVP
jgi:hypothetical protein